MTTWNISLNRLEPPQLKEALLAIRKGLEEVGVDFYLIGAVARDLYLRQIYAQKVNRPTLDIDVAVLISSEEEYARLKQHLVRKHAFMEKSENAFSLVHANGTIVDLMPFGEIAGAGDWVKVQGVGMTTISVPGIAEAYETAGELQTEEGDLWRVCTLPGMCVLKLLAWQERPEWRSKDLQDLANIMHQYEYIVQEELFDLHAGLLEEEITATTSPEYMVYIATRILGRHMQVITRRSPQLHQRITGFLQKEIEAGQKSSLAQAWAKVNKTTVVEATAAIARMWQGLNDVRE